MKPKTKKIIIIAAVVLAVAVGLWLVFRKKTTRTLKSLVDQLFLSDSLKSQMEQKVAEVEAYAAANPTGEGGWTKESLLAKAAEKGVSYEQMVLIEAAYNLFTLDVITWSEYSTIENRIKNLQP